MNSRRTPRWRSLLLLSAVLFSTMLPRAFVVCVTDDDHVALEAVFEGDPCETKFIFGARSEAGWPRAACTDFPAAQISMLTDGAPAVEALQAIAPVAFASTPVLTRSQFTPRHPAPPRPLREVRALRTTVLRL